MNIWAARIDRMMYDLALQDARADGALAFDEVKAAWNLSDAQVRPWRPSETVTLTRDLREREL